MINSLSGDCLTYSAFKKIVVIYIIFYAGLNDFRSFDFQVLLFEELDA